MGWDDLRLDQVGQGAAGCPDACGADVVSLIAEVRRLRAAIVDQHVTGGDVQCAICLSYADSREAVIHEPDCVMAEPGGGD